MAARSDAPLWAGGLRRNLKPSRLMNRSTIWRSEVSSTNPMAKRSQPGRAIKNFGLQHAKARSIAPTALACEVRDEKPLSVYLEPVVMAQLTELAERKHQSISLVAEAAIASVLAAEDRDLAARRNRFFWGEAGGGAQTHGHRLDLQAHRRGPRQSIKQILPGRATPSPTKPRQGTTRFFSGVN
jgi:predicted transcriptional regulator